MAIIRIDFDLDDIEDDTLLEEVIRRCNNKFTGFYFKNTLKEALELQELILEPENLQEELKMDFLVKNFSRISLEDLEGICK